jgi:RNA 2',3'-cyclic 3'-phosphodiesterase
MKYRMFVAIPIPENVKYEILDSLKLPKFYKITPGHNIHITILFLGETEKSMIPQIDEIINKSVSKIQKFKLEIDSFGQFPEKGLPRIIFVTGKNKNETLFKLADKIRSNLKNLGFNDEKDFKYHITVGRLKKREKIVQKVIIPELKNKIAFDVDKIILYKSDLQQSCPVYTNISEYNLL